jgi:hypothetical protein
MTRKKMLGSQVKRLITSLSEQGSQHLTEVETDLVQTTFLLGEAIQKLGASFMAIHEAVCAQQETVELLLAGGAPSAENVAKIRALQNQIGQHVNAAVTGLQFQDMTSQLIGRTVRRVSGLREVLAMMSENSAGMLPESETDHIVELLNDLNKVIEEHSTKLESILWKPVRQTHMESGDVELF